MINRCQELLDVWHVSKVYFVMDGKRCPLKAVYEAKEREERRVSNLKGAREFKSLGMHYKAEEKYKMCIKIRDDFAYLVMQQVSEAFGNDDRVELVWSPYEADAQLAKLCMDLQSDAVITEVCLDLLSWFYNE
jgi:exonuclease-1